MPLPAGARLGPYEIGALLGTGGMGEVYLARDTRLNRDVAIKMLPDAFAQDAERLLRFEREAQTLASLNHPRIAQIYGVEEHSGRRGLVMELVNGPTLADQLARGPLAIDDAVAIAIQIAEALEAAHDRGIVHRDLKPANVKVAADGQVKVLDFGLAKETGDGATHGAALLNSPTITSPALTHHGVILGTAAYMSPEQARGKPVDRRADLWAFGCVLYEMLAGVRPFDGETVTDILGAVTRSEPDWSRLPEDLPSNVERVLRRCLRKDAKQRLGHATAILIDLQEADEASVAVAARSTWRTALPWTVAGVALATAAATLVLAGGRTNTVPAGLPLIRGDVVLPEMHLGDQFALSPDGRFVAYLTRAASGLRSIATRDLASGEIRRFSDTESASSPFWSADSQQIGYFVRQQRLKILEIRSGVSRAMSVELQTPASVRASWSPDGTIIFGGRDGIFSVREGAASPQRLTTLRDGEAFHVDPSFLPDGRRFLFTAVSADRRNTTVFVASTAGGEIARVVDGAGSTGYADGHLLYERDGRLHGQRLDMATLTPLGPPVLIAPEIARDVRSARVALSVSAAGVLLFRDTNAGSNTRLAEFDRSGKLLRQLAAGAALSNLALSPDGTRIAFNASETGRRHIWTLHLQRETQVRLSVGSSFDHDPVWSPDGTAIIYGSDAATGFGIYRQASAGGGNPEPIVTAKSIAYPNTWSRDGRFMIYTIVDATTARDLWLYSFHDRSSRVWVQNNGSDDMADFSPDGRWVAHTSDVSGRGEVYVRSTDGTGREWQVTTSGALEPHWRDDGKELYYLDPATDALMAVDVMADVRSIEFGKPRQLFVLALGDVSRTRYTVTSHGQRVIAATTEPSAAFAPARMIVNWQRLFRPSSAQ